MRISKHFTLREVSKSTTADRNGIDNTPSAEVVAAAKLLAEKVLDPIREHFRVPFSPESWYRCEALEKIICEKSFAKWTATMIGGTWEDYFRRKSHPKGEAADIEVPGISNDTLFNWIRDNLEFDQLIREFRKPGDPESGWVHVSFSADRNRKIQFSVN